MEKLNGVLIVDDDPTSIFMSELILSDLHLTNQIYKAYNGSEALDLLQAFCDRTSATACPEIILLDINMPVMNGFEFLENFQKDYNKAKDTFVIVLTSSEDSRDISKARQFGITSYIAKPLTTEKAESIKNMYTLWKKTKNLNTATGLIME